jgi:hypothetical protein
MFEADNITAQIKSLSQIFYVHKRFLIRQTTFPGEVKKRSSWRTQLPAPRKTHLMCDTSPEGQIHI